MAKVKPNYTECQACLQWQLENELVDCKTCGLLSHEYDVFFIGTRYAKIGNAVGEYLVPVEDLILDEIDFPIN